MGRIPIRPAEELQFRLVQDNLEHCHLHKTDLTNATLTNASVGGANFEGAKLEGADVRVTGWEAASFQAASYDSKTQFPEGFDPEKQGMVLSSNKQQPEWDPNIVEY